MPYYFHYNLHIKDVFLAMISFFFFHISSLKRVVLGSLVNLIQSSYLIDKSQDYNDLVVDDKVLVHKMPLFRLPERKSKFPR